MSNIVPIEQSSYNQGMILGVRQDSSFERNDMQSAYWIENLTPNVILGELYTRNAQEQDIHGTTPVETAISGEPISALEMTHAVSTSPDTSVLHIFSTNSPTIQTTNLSRTGFNQGVWSSNGVFEFPVADYDVYGESVLLVSDQTPPLTQPKRRAVYAYTYKDYDQYFGQKNESNKDLFLFGITPKPNTGVQRWEVLDENDLEKIIEPLFVAENADGTNEPEYYTAEVPQILGKPLQITNPVIVVMPAGTREPVKLLQTSYKIRSGSNVVTITSWGYMPASKRFSPSTGKLAKFIVPVLGPPEILPNTDPTATAPPVVTLKKLMPIMWSIQDYVKDNTPRVWLPGEKIPYVITAIVNGIEKIIKKDVYLPFPTNTVDGVTVMEEKTEPRQDNSGDYNDGTDTIGNGGSNTAPVANVRFTNEVLPIGGIGKVVKFNIKIKALPQNIPIGLSEIRLYIANKNVGERGLFDYAFPNEPTIGEVTDIEPYNGWVTLPESLYRQPDSERESFSYSLAKSFVVFGDPDLYARRNVKTDHSNWGVNNIKVNEWKYDTDGFIIGNDQTEPPLAPLYTANSEFYIWDYMDRTAEPLATNLQQALFLWKGKGAKILASMKGVTFIAGCLDGIGKLEVGLIRKSLLQGAVQSTDTFAETDFIKVGNETHTALIEFRGQLWAFSRTQMHRIQMRDMADLDTIEVLEVLENNGTFSPKTVIATPFGVAWCNESGVWLSNGGEPTLLSKEIEPLYLSMVRGTNWISQTGDRLDWDIRGDLYNKKLQIVYDNAKYDLTISAFALRLPNAITPEGENKHLDIRLCYNIVYKNWRIETYPLNLTHTETSFASRHRTHWSFGKYKSLGWRGSNVRVNTLGRLESDFGELLIDNRLVLHEIGNGIDDMQANSVSIEAAYTKTTPLVLPKLTLTTGNPTQPFQFAGRQNTTDPIAKGELVSYHISGITDPYWSENKIDTPIETPAQTVSMLAKPLPLRMTYDMTSQHHHVPFMKPVRRFMAEYIVRGRVRLRSMRFILRLFTRKFWG